MESSYLTDEQLCVECGTITPYTICEMCPNVLTTLDEDTHDGLCEQCRYIYVDIYDND